MSIAEPTPIARTANSIIRERVKRLLRQTDLTQTEFAPKLGLKQSSLSVKMSGKRAFTADELLVIARIFGVSMDYLYGKTDDPRPVGPNGDRLEVVDPGRIELPTSCLQSRRSTN